LESFWEPLGTFLGENGREGDPNRTKAIHFFLIKQGRRRTIGKKGGFFEEKSTKAAKNAKNWGF
jgi:hypothetical protein